MRTTQTAWFTLTLALVACGGSNLNEAPQLAPMATTKPRVPMPPATPRLSSAAIAEVPAGTFGPYLGMGRTGGLAVWASGDGDARSWFARPLSAVGADAGASVQLGSAPTDLGLVTVRADHAGFALLATHRASAGEVVELSLLKPDGNRATGPNTLGRTAGSLLWVDLIPNANGAFVLWAAGGAGHAEIWVAQSNSHAELVGTPQVLSRDAGAWQAVAFGKGFALAVAHVGKSGIAHGPLDVTLVGDSGTPAPPISVSLEPSADLDLDMAAFGEARDRIALAWTDHRAAESRVFSCVIDASGKLLGPPAPATTPLGEQAMLRVVPPVEGSARAYLAWEALDAQSKSYRTFQVAEFQADGRVSEPRGSFEYWKMDGSVPEVVGTARGIAVLTLAPVCPRNEECTTNDLIAPEFVEFDHELRVTTTEPVWVQGTPAPASLAWNLTCPNDSCFALEAERGHEAAVSVARLEYRSDVYRAPADHVELPARPRVVSEEALVETDPLAEIAFTQTSSGTLLGWLTEFDPTTPWVKLKKPTSDGRREPLRARIGLQGFASTAPFAPLAPAEDLSLRAHSLGGLALSGDPQKSDVLAAWTGVDSGQPQVFLTLVDSLGKKVSQRMLTHKKGECSDLTTLAVDNDYLVAWVDERTSDPEVYATRVNHALNRVAPEQRITQAPGSATDLTLVATQTGALLVWADARDAETPGSADIYAAALRPKDASRIATEAPIQKTRPHSFSPVARAYGKTTLVAWLEAATDGDPAQVDFAVLDDSGRLQGDVQSSPLATGNPLTLGLDCGADACHALVSVDEASHGVLYAITYRNGLPSPAVKVWTTAGPPSSVAPVLHGREAYVADSQQGRGRLRRLLLDW